MVLLRKKIRRKVKKKKIMNKMVLFKMRSKTKKLWSKTSKASRMFLLSREFLTEKGINPVSQRMYRKITAKQFFHL